MPPVPITTTVSPRSTFARLSTAPTPVSTPQPIRAADVSGMSAGIFTACTALTRVRSANAELEANWYSGLPPRENGCPGIPIALRHIVGLPRSHWAHAPQLASVDSETWSPGATCVTPAPIVSTTPAPSCPSTTGSGNGMVPSTTERSLWHRPHGRHRDEHLAGPRVTYLQVVDDLGLLAVEDDASHLGSLGRPSTRSAMMFRWISSEPP